MTNKAQDTQQEEKLLSRLEDLIRQGKNNLVQTELKKIVKSKVPRELAYRFAEIARRSNMPLMALQVMNPIIRSEVQLAIPVSDKEKITYATALTSISACEEALEILNEVNYKKEPQVLLYKAFAYFAQWKYEEAIPSLNRFIHSDNITDYQRVVGKVNLLASYIASNKTKDAFDLAKEILKITKQNNHKLLHGNTRELLAQLYIFSGEYKKARIELEEAQKSLTDSDSIYLTFVHKWQLILDLLTSKPSSQLQERITMVRKSALRQKHWETLREIDFFSALAQKNESEIIQVLSGTPFKGYIQRAESLLGKPISLPTETSRTRDKNAEWIFNLFESRLINRKSGKIIKMRIPKTLFQFLVALSKDYYRPLSLGLVFSQVYPEEHFNPIHSKKKIDNLVLRSRKLFQEFRIPIRVEVDQHQYSLRLNTGIELRLRNIKRKNLYQRADISNLHSAFKDKNFSAQQASEVLSLSKRSTHTLLSEAIKKSIIIRLGQGSAIRYRFSNKRTKNLNLKQNHYATELE